jgi:transposase
MGPDRTVVARSVIPLTAGDRVKTDRRGAVMSAKRHRAGDLTALRVPGAAQEAGRDLVGARATAMRGTGTLAVNVAGQPFAFSVVSISADR